MHPPYRPYRPPGHARPANPGSVSGTLGVGVGAIFVAAFCGLGTLILTFAGGKELLRGVLDDLLRSQGLAASAALRGSAVELVLDEAYEILVSRAYLFAVVAAVFLLLGATIWARRNWARIIFTIVALPAAALWLRSLSDVNIPTVHILDAVALAAVALALVTIWLRPSNRSFRAAKAARAAR